MTPGGVWQVGCSDPTQVKGGNEKGSPSLPSVCVLISQADVLGTLSRRDSGSDRLRQRPILHPGLSF